MLISSSPAASRHGGVRLSGEKLPGAGSALAPIVLPASRPLEFAQAHERTAMVVLSAPDDECLLSGSVSRKGG
jgi:hypothetical protein